MTFDGIVLLITNKDEFYYSAGSPSWFGKEKQEIKPKRLLSVS